MHRQHKFIHFFKRMFISFSFILLFLYYCIYIYMYLSMFVSMIITGRLQCLHDLVTANVSIVYSLCWRRRQPFDILCPLLATTTPSSQ
jgi:hypothetical protein